jgi:hypothetical protein
MDRLMCLHVESCGEPVELLVNGMPVLRLPAGGGTQGVTVHEYLLAGPNQISLVVAPPPILVAAAGTALPAQPRLAARPLRVQARLVLLRQGKRLGDGSGRTLAELNWTAQEGQAFEAPTVLHQALELPVGFPRWRWLDAPVVTWGPTERQQVLAFLQRCAFDLSRGNPDALVTAARLRFEELGQAYQLSESQLVARFREQVQKLYEAQALASIKPPTAETLLLRPVAGGRLLEALSPLGSPVLATAHEDPAQPHTAWPLRLTLIEGKVYILR